MRFAVNEINKQVNFSKAKKHYTSPQRAVGVGVGVCRCVVGRGEGEREFQFFSPKKLRVLCMAQGSRVITC